uniref:Rheb1 n=1 Tax=Rhabdomonas costata TaxID=118010 RepID=A0A2R4IKY9_9EUGL|nr:Rheb1 [Rhabdomonas costata]
MPTAPPVWKPDSSSSVCEACQRPFTFFTRRRHHCRHCGALFCYACSGSRSAIPKFGFTEEVRVCDACFDLLQREEHRGVDKEPVESFLKQRKICILGYSAVGKSCLTQQFVEERFNQAYNPTINHTYSKRVRAKGEEYLLSLLDTAGQDECSLFQPQFSIGTHGYILVYSIADPVSFEMVSVIYEKIHSFAVDVVLVLVGNKCDLERDRQVSFEQGQALARGWKCPFIECSAKRKDNVAKVFLTILEEILTQEDGGPRPSRWPSWLRF